MKDEELDICDFLSEEKMNRRFQHWRYYRRCIFDFFDIPEYFRRIHAFIQRGRRGWSDRDVWSLDGYLCDWLPEALIYLKNTKHGTPCQVYPDDCEIDPDHGGPTKAADEAAAIVWEKIIQKMMDGFAAMRRIKNNDYDSEVEQMTYYKKGQSKEEYRVILRAHTVKVEEWEKRQRAIFNEGFDLFKEYFECLWD